MKPTTSSERDQRADQERLVGEPGERPRGARRAARRARPRARRLPGPGGRGLGVVASVVLMR